MSIPSFEEKLNRFRAFEEKLNRFREQYDDEHSCKCPECGFDLNSDCEYMVELVTYHGESGRLEHECPSCETIFWVEEKVDRTWNVFKTEDEEEEI